MQLSVVIPTYKRARLLKRCLIALITQEMDKKLYEIIVVSDGPDAETENLVNELSACSAVTLKYLALPIKKGPAAARNYGWLNARGKIIAFTDDDCIPRKQWLNEICRSLDPDSLQAITGRVIVPHNKRPTDHEKNTAGLETAAFITANCACTKAALLKTGGFDEQFSMAWREDSDLEFKLLTEQIPVKRVPSAVVIHPVRMAKWGISIKEQKKTLYNALLYKKFPQLYRQKIQTAPPFLYYAIIAAFIFMLAGLFIKNQVITPAGFSVWIALNIYFIIKRLYHTRLTPGHIAEMVITSLVIPFLSVYWQWYGAFKYRVLFI